MVKTISIKTKIGWVSAYENKGKIVRIKFGKEKKQNKSKILKLFKQSLNNFFAKKTSNIKVPHKIIGSQIQKKIWSELKHIKPGCTKSYGEIAKKHKLSPRHIG